MSAQWFVAHFIHDSLLEVKYLSVFNRNSSSQCSYVITMNIPYKFVDDGHENGLTRAMHMHCEEREDKHITQLSQLF